MAGITQKSCVGLLLFWWPLSRCEKSITDKKVVHIWYAVFTINFPVGPSIWNKLPCGGREVGRTDANQQKHAKIEKLKFDKKSCQYDDNCNNNYYFSDNKDKK